MSAPSGAAALVLIVGATELWLLWLSLALSCHSLVGPHPTKSVIGGLSVSCFFTSLKLLFHLILFRASRKETTLRGGTPYSRTKGIATLDQRSDPRWHLSTEPKRKCLPVHCPTTAPSVRLNRLQDPHDLGTFSLSSQRVQHHHESRIA